VIVGWAGGGPRNSVRSEPQAVRVRATLDVRHASTIRGSSLFFTRRLYVRCSASVKEGRFRSGCCREILDSKNDEKVS
jgi:hypothetical protein